MSDACPILTSKDIELIGNLRNEISDIQASEKIFLENISQCDNQSGGGFKEVIIDNLTNLIVFSITALAAGASVAFFLTVLPQTYQMYIISLANGNISFSPCMTTSDYAWGMIGSFANPTFSCSYRAQMLEQGINRIQIAAGVVTGVTGVALRDKIKIYITRIIDGESVPSNSDTKINISERGGRRKSRSGKRKSRKSRKIRRIKKH
jgi:hypothetical protein